jgi:16S rRNA processing protein RimM
MWSGDVRLVVASVRPYRDRGLIVGFEGVRDRNAAEALRGARLSIPPGDLPPLEAGEFWPADLVGLQAFDPSGQFLGEVAGVIHGPQDRIVVATPGGGRVEVPFVDDLVADPDGDRIVIDAPPGMFDPADAGPG